MTEIGQSKEKGKVKVNEKMKRYKGTKVKRKRGKEVCQRACLYCPFEEFSSARPRCCHPERHLFMVGCCASSCTHQAIESVSEWKRVVSHHHVSGHLCMVAEPSCVLRRRFPLDSTHDG